MWMLFHRKGKTKPVRGGETFEQTCPECGEHATFREVEISESYGVFFVDVVSDKERAVRCDACDAVFDVKDDAPTAPAPPTKSLAELERERAIEQQRRREQAEVKAVRIEDELAELKKRMGKKP